MSPRAPAQLGLFLALALLLFASPVHAYVRALSRSGVPSRWAAPCITLHVYAGEPPRTVDQETVLRATRLAAGAWSRRAVMCTAIDIAVAAAPEPEAPVAFDGVNRVTFRRETWCKTPREADEPCHDPSAIAVTSVFRRPDSAEILDADIEINAVNITWADRVGNAAAPPEAYDLQNALTHEVGHLLGLEHNCSEQGLPPRTDHQGQVAPACGALGIEERAATMFPSVMATDVERRTLTADDTQAVCDIYPAQARRCTPAVPDVVGGCALGGRGQGALALLAALAIARGVLRRRAR